MQRSGAGRWPARVLGGALALLLLAPALAPGTVLVDDMVVVPRLDLDPDALGLGTGAPRAVPGDAVLAVLTTVVPGSLVQVLTLLATVVAAVVGGARLVTRLHPGAQVGGLVAGATYGWSPYLAERLLMGHWSLLAGVAALPWVVLSALDLREADARPHRWARLVLVAAPAALTPTGLLLSLGAALAGAGRHRLPTVLGVHLGLALPWVVAAAAGTGASGSDPAGVAAFAARAEQGTGPVATLWSLLGSGGIWNAAAVPPGRSTVVAVVGSALLLGAASAGWWGRLREPAARRLLLIGVTGLVLALLGALPGTADLLADAVAVPGAGLLRDGQKWVAWWLLAAAVGAGLGVQRLVPRVAAGWRTGGPALLVVAGLLVPALATPGLALGVSGRLEPVAWPDDWSRVRSYLLEHPDGGDLVTLPRGAVRAFGWNDRRTQADPAQRWLPVPVVVDDDLVVGGELVSGEDTRAREVLAAVDDPARLAALGVGWVLVERDTPGPAVPAAVRALPLVVDGPDLQLHRVPGVQPREGAKPLRTVAVVMAHALAATLVLVAAGVAVAGRRRSHDRGTAGPVPLPSWIRTSTVRAARRSGDSNERRSPP